MKTRDRQKGNRRLAKEKGKNTGWVRIMAETRDIKGKIECQNGVQWNENNYKNGGRGKNEVRHGRWEQDEGKWGGRRLQKGRLGWDVKSENKDDARKRNMRNRSELRENFQRLRRLGEKNRLG